MLYNPVPEGRVCRQCHQWFPRAQLAKDRRSRFGVKALCLSCHAERLCQYRRAHPDRIQEANRRSRQKRLLNDPQSVRAYNRETMRQWRSANHNKAREHQRRDRIKHPEKHRAYRQKYRQSLKGRRKSMLYAQHWRIAHPEYARTHAARRRARQRLVGGSYTSADVKRQYTAQKGRCYWCGKKVGDTYHVDHVIPLDKGGSNGPENIVIACPFCNDSKGAKLPHEWEGSGGKLL